MKFDGRQPVPKAYRKPIENQKTQERVASGAFQVLPLRLAAEALRLGRRTQAAAAWSDSESDSDAGLGACHCQCEPSLPGWAGFRWHRATVTGGCQPGPGADGSEPGLGLH